MRQGNIRFIEIPEFNESDYALRYSVNVDGISAVMEIPDCAVLAEKVRPIELETLTDAGIKFRCVERLSDGLQRAEVVSGMEIVNPFLRSRLTVIPGSVRVLL